MPFTKRLTQKETSFVELVASGMSQTDAAMQAYDCKDRNSAKTMGTQLMAKPRISQRLTERDEKVQKIMLDKNMTIHKMIESLISRQDVAEALKTNLMSKDARVRDQAIDKYFKVFGSYAANKNMNLIMQQAATTLNELKE